MTSCTQCGKPAVIKSDEVSLCVDCFAKYQDALTKQQLANQQQTALLMSMINYMDRHMWAQIGMMPPNQIEIPSLVSSLGDQIVTNTFNIANSVIGVLSAGQQNSLRNIAVNLQGLQAPQTQEVAAALKAVAEAIAESAELAIEAKTEALEYLEELSAQAARQPAQRSKPSALRAIVASLHSLLAAGGAAAEVWSTWGPQIRTFFGL
jgi:hypothetical protein